jgi:hypothetical protein
MSPQAFAEMTSNIRAGRKANNQSKLRESIGAAFDVADMCEVMITTTSPVKRIAI